MDHKTRTYHAAEPLPFAMLRDSGLLWLINATVFHPRGFAMGIDFDDDGNATGWVLYGDGNEPWTFASNTRMDAEIDERFAAAQKLLAPRPSGSVDESYTDS